MATTKKTTNKSGKTQSSGKSTKKKKKSSDDTMKFLLVLVIAGIAIALIFFSQKDDTQEGSGTATPTPVTAAGTTETPENPTAAPTAEPTGTQQQTEHTPAPTAAPESTVAPEETSAPTSTPIPTPTLTPTPTPTPTPALSADEAEKVVKGKVDTTVYRVQMVNENLVVGNNRYYQFGAIKDQEFASPFLVVNQADGSLHFYDSTEGTIYDFTKFPVNDTVAPTPTNIPEQEKILTAKEAYEVLCSYSKEALNIAKDIKEYDVEYDEELTLIDGIDCYRFNLSEFSNGKVRNRGEFFVSVDGKKCYYIDSDTNEFILAVK